MNGASAPQVRNREGAAPVRERLRAACGCHNHLWVLLAARGERKWLRSGPKMASKWPQNGLKVAPRCYTGLVLRMAIILWCDSVPLSPLCWGSLLSFPKGPHEAQKQKETANDEAHSERSLYHSRFAPVRYHVNRQTFVPKCLGSGGLLLPKKRCL